MAKHEGQDYEVSNKEISCPVEFERHSTSLSKVMACKVKARK
jgi:hypothetical protein